MLARREESGLGCFTVAGPVQHGRPDSDRAEGGMPLTGEEGVARGDRRRHGHFTESAHWGAKSGSMGRGRSQRGEQPRCAAKASEAGCTYALVSPFAL